VQPEITLRDARRIIFVLLLFALWAAVPRPSVALRDLDNASMCLWEDETKGGWRHRLRAPPDRLLVSPPPPPSSPLLPPSLRARSVVDESSLVFSRLVCERPRCLKLCCARHGCGLLHWRERCRLLYVRWVGRCWRQVVDLLKEAMGNRSYGRGADPYCGGVDFEDEWFSRPLLRPCHVNLSLASPCLVFLVPAPDLVPSPC
jgi:hypothetical protein